MSLIAKARIGRFRDQIGAASGWTKQSFPDSIGQILTRSIDRLSFDRTGLTICKKSRKVPKTCPIDWKVDRSNLGAAETCSDAFLTVFGKFLGYTKGEMTRIKGRTFPNLLGCLRASKLKEKKIPRSGKRSKARFLREKKMAMVAAASTSSSTVSSSSAMG